MSYSILNYWFGMLPTAPKWELPIASKRQIWYSGTPEVDKEITTLFKHNLKDMKSGKLEHWLSGQEGDILAGIILMDQFSRNIYRGTPRAFEMDNKALAWAKILVNSGRDRNLRFIERQFVYMPFMHSELLQDQEECVRLFKNLVADCKHVASEVYEMEKMVLKYAEAHRDVIMKWGRFPHRNEILGRSSTVEEKRGLQDGSIPRW
jgi:uncharacterized protein (DUF924 family)